MKSWLRIFRMKTLLGRACELFLDGFVIAEPTGKQNATAAHNPPEYVAVSVRHNTAPRNLANAFEVPVRVKGEESLTTVSAKGLLRKRRSYLPYMVMMGNLFISICLILRQPSVIRRIL